MSATGATQSNVKYGLLTALAAVSLIGKEGLLAVITNDTGVAKAALPSAQNDLALYVVVEGAAAGALATLQPLVAVQQARVRLNGTINPGVEVVLDVGSAGDYGKIKAKPATAGQYLVIGVAEEIGIDEQLVLIRPNPRMVQVASAVVAAGGAPGATYAQSEAADVQGKLNSVITALKAAGIVASA